MPQCEEKGNDCKIGDVEVLRSNAGYYIGYYCEACGPWDRLSDGYFATKEEAEKQLDEVRKKEDCGLDNLKSPMAAWEEETYPWMRRTANE